MLTLVILIIGNHGSNGNTARFRDNEVGVGDDE